MLIDKNPNNKHPFITRISNEPFRTLSSGALNVNEDENLFLDLDSNDADGSTVVTNTGLTGTDKSESFREVFDEMSRNLPDSTSTIEEKQTAISYIDRMLACDDIPPEMKTYWQNKKEIIQQEIVRIENQKKVGSGEKVQDVWKELQNFADKYSKDLNETLSPEDRKEYLDTFNTTCITYYMRLMTCTDVTPAIRAEYMKSIFNHIRDMQGY